MTGERQQLDWQRLLNEALTTPGNMTGVYDRYHDYSLTNMLLFHLQGIHEPVASFSRWKSLGRHVLQGSQAKDVIVPVLVKEPTPEETAEEKRERVARLIGFKVVRAVFALSDTEGPEPPPIRLPGWDVETALAKLGIRQVPFEEVNGNIQGYSSGVDIAINPTAVRPAKTLMHEMGHVILGHTLPHALGDYATHRGIKEFQAEAIAYLTMNELGQLDEEAASTSRRYIQHWLHAEQPPDKAIQQVFSATDRILRAVYY
jgi:hypothetical protein